MRLLTVLCVLLCSAAFAGAAPSEAGLERASVRGEGYFRLSQWAARFGLTVNRDAKTGAVDLTNASIRLAFEVNSRKARARGQTILLSLPVLARGEDALVSVVDAQTALEPLLAPKTGGTVKVVCLDPGHGGKDTGKIDGKNLEKKYTLLLAKETAQALQARGFKTVLTRSRDQFVDLADRPAIAKRNGADVFVSLHYNAAPPGVGGVEVYCLAPPGVASSNEGGGRAARQASPGNVQNSRNMLLAFLLQRHILRGVEIEDRGLKRARFEVLREAAIPAVLIEGGFMTRPSDAKKIYDPVFRKRMAQAIAEGIAAYKEAIETGRGR